jgi:hypothetical protein
VGQKGLYSAEAAVHGDCAQMITSLAGLSDALIRRGTSAADARPVIEALHGSLSRLEAALERAVQSGRLSAARRLALEQALPGLVAELGGTLPLVALLDRAARPRPLEASPVGWVHGSSSEGSADETVPAIFVSPAELPEAGGLNIDLAAAKTLIVLAVALVAQRTPARPLQLRFQARRGVAQTLVGWGAESTAGVAVRIASLPLVPATLGCAQIAARRLGGSLEFSSEPLGVGISWPLS